MACFSPRITDTSHDKLRSLTTFSLLQGSEQAFSSIITLDDANEGKDPTPSLSASPPAPRLPSGKRGSDISNGSDNNDEEEDGAREKSSIKSRGEENAATTEAISVAEEVTPLAKSQQNRQAERASSPPISSVSAAVVLRVLRATVVVLGGCGLGGLPSDRDLWAAVKPMLVDGSLRHRVRHFDRRVRRSLLLFTIFNYYGGP